MTEMGLARILEDFTFSSPTLPLTFHTDIRPVNERLAPRNESMNATDRHDAADLDTPERLAAEDNAAERHRHATSECTPPRADTECVPERVSDARRSERLPDAAAFPG